MSAVFIRRGFPHANSVLLAGPRAVLVDAGAPGGEAELRQWLGPVRPVLVVNTHWHSDHAGGNHAWAALGVPIGAGVVEGAAVNRGDADAGRKDWLRQAVPPYRVERLLRDGEAVETGAAEWKVVALPGHTAGQIGFFEAVGRVLVAGDAMHAADVGWLDLDADPAALERAEETVERIAALEPAVIYSGHGAAITDVGAALGRARRRLRSWRAEPERIAWHACKRIFGHQLFTEGGLARERVAPVLLDAPWFRDHARRGFGLSPEGFVAPLLAEMLRSGAASWRGDRLMPGEAG